MFPIRDHNASIRAPFVTYALIAINVVVFIGMIGTYPTDRALMGFYADYAMIPARISAGDGYYTFLTSMFLHGGWMHLLGNMLFLWIFGDNLEDVLGHVRFLLFYLITGVGADLAQYAAAPESMVPLVGASGAIAGVMGGYLLLFPRAQVDLILFLIFIIRIITLPAWAMLGYWFVVQLLSGIGTSAGGGGVAYLAHAGGFALGFVLMIPTWLSRGGRGHWEQTSGRPTYPNRPYRIGRSDIPVVRRRR